MSSFIIVSGKKIPVKHEVVPISKLLLDRNNPRIFTKAVNTKSDYSQESIRDLLLGMTKVAELKTAIMENGGLLESVIAVFKDGEYIVYEGNCRCACLFALSLNDERFSQVPCIVIDHKDITDEDRVVLLSGIHVAEKISWAAYDKARYINEELLGIGKTKAWICEHLRTNQHELESMILSYKETKRYNESLESKNYGVYSYFHEFFRSTSLRGRFFESPFIIDSFHRWISEGRFGMAIHVRKLPAVLSSPEATEEFLKTNIVKAYEILKSTSPDMTIPIFKTLKAVTSRIRKVSDKDLFELKNHSLAAKRRIGALIKSLQKMDSAIEELAVAS